MTAELWLTLTEPPGPPGSGRRRYGAAMALHASGALTTAQLEAYREAATTDAIDPRRVMADRGLAPPEPPAATIADRLRYLLSGIDRCLTGLYGPGIAETRSRLAPFLLTAPQPRPAARGRKTPVVTHHLPHALRSLAATDPALATAIGALANDLDWITCDACPEAEIGPHFGKNHAFTSLIGAGAPWAAKGFDLGLFLLAPGLLYRDHAHPAAELYLPLTGPHHWRFAPGRPFRALPALRPVWNPPNQPHATLTGDLPFLSLFAWTGDVDAAAQVLPAPDWGRYE